MEDRILRYLERDISKNAIMLNDIRNGCKVKYVLDGKDLAVGTISEFEHNYYAHIRGNDDKSVYSVFDKVLSSRNDKKEMRFISPVERNKIIREKYRIREPNISLLSLKRGDENLDEERYRTVRLRKEDRSGVSRLVGDRKHHLEGVLTCLQNDSAYGIFEGKCLVSIATVLFEFPPVLMLDHGYTEKSRRNEGYVGSIVDHIIREYFNDNELFSEVQLYTAVDNFAVHNLMKKRGFKECGIFEKFYV